MNCLFDAEDYLICLPILYRKLVYLKLFFLFARLVLLIVHHAWQCFLLFVDCLQNLCTSSMTNK